MAPRDPSNRLGTILINPVILPVPVERQHSLDLPQDGTTTSSSFSSSSSPSILFCLRSLILKTIDRDSNMK